MSIYRLYLQTCLDQNVVSAGMHHTTIFDSQESFAKATPKTAETPIALIQKIISYLYHFLTKVTDSQGNESLKKNCMSHHSPTNENLNPNLTNNFILASYHNNLINTEYSFSTYIKNKIK